MKQNKQEKFMTLSVQTLEKVHKASYKAAELIVKAKKPHTIAKTLLTPACKEMLKIILRPEAASEIHKVPLSADTINC
jgi:hypothetical protein